MKTGDQTNRPQKQPIDRLTEETRIKGESRMIPDNTPPEQVTAEQAGAVVRRIVQYLHDNADVSRTKIARDIGIAGTTLGSVLNGNYKGNSNGIIVDLDKWLEDRLKRDASPKVTGFVRTKVAEEIFTMADAAITMRTIALIYGPKTSGLGKTVALRAVEEEKPGAIYVSVATATATASGLLQAICRAARIGSARHETGILFNRARDLLAGTSRLLIVDEVHKLLGQPNDRPLHVLRDLYDATGAPQLWSGTEDVVQYLERGQAKGREPLAQIRSRIGVVRDLLDRCDPSQPGGGQPLYTTDEIRQVFGRGKMRLAPDAAMYLMRLANHPDSGALRTCRNLVVMTEKVNAAAANVMTQEMLRAVHRLLCSRKVYEQLEAEIQAAAPARALRAG